MDSLVANAADKNQVKSASKKVVRDRNQELEDIRFILKTEQGRRFIWRYLGICRLYETSFTGNSQTFFFEGMRNVGLELIADVTAADPQGYLKMMQENQKEGD